MILAEREIRTKRIVQAGPGSGVQFPWGRGDARPDGDTRRRRRVVQVGSNAIDARIAWCVKNELRMYNLRGQLQWVYSPPSPLRTWDCVFTDNGDLWLICGDYPGFNRQVTRHNAYTGTVLETFAPASNLAGTWHFNYGGGNWLATDGVKVIWSDIDDFPGSSGQDVKIGSDSTGFAYMAPGTGGYYHGVVAAGRRGTYFDGYVSINGVLFHQGSRDTDPNHQLFHSPRYGLDFDQFSTHSWGLNWGEFAGTLPLFQFKTWYGQVDFTNGFTNGSYTVANFPPHAMACLPWRAGGGLSGPGQRIACMSLPIIEQGVEIGDSHNIDACGAVGPGLLLIVVSSFDEFTNRARLTFLADYGSTYPTLNPRPTFDFGALPILEPIELVATSFVDVGGCACWIRPRT